MNPRAQTPPNDGAGHGCRRDHDGRGPHGGRHHGCLEQRAAPADA